MRILLASGGGREHALAWRFHKDGHQVYTDGRANPGMRAVSGSIGVMDRDDPRSLAVFARSLKVDLTVIGGETLLSKGVVDLFESRGLAIVGPTQSAARLETSKFFCYQTLRGAGVRVPLTNRQTREELRLCLRGARPPYVVKFDGLAAGKGAMVVLNRDDVADATREMAQYGEGPFLIQEFIPGQEVSFFVATDGTNVTFLGSAADYKGLYAGGPMTGGMGGYAPNPLVTKELHARIMQDVVEPTVAYMKAIKNPYRGILYFQLMVTPRGEVYVIEINVRFGDPEAQLLMPLYQGDLAKVLASTVKGRQLDSTGFSISSQLCSVGVVLAAAGYPGPVRKGDAISGLDRFASSDAVFFAGVTDDEHRGHKTSGGRVVTMVGVGANIRLAHHAAYLMADAIHLKDKQHRDDIAIHLI